MTRISGRYWRVLEKQGVLDKTAVVWSSDHGFFLGEHRFYDKRLMYEPSIRIPLMVRYPPRIKAGTSVDKMVLNWTWRRRCSICPASRFQRIFKARA